MEAAPAVIEALPGGPRVDDDVVVVKLNVRRSSGMRGAMRCHQTICRCIVPVYNGIPAPAVHAAQSGISHRRDGDGVILKEHVVSRPCRRWWRRRVYRANTHECRDTAGRSESIMIDNTIKIRNRRVFPKKYPPGSARQIKNIIVNSNLLQGSRSVEPNNKLPRKQVVDSGEVESRNTVEIIIGPRQIAIHPYYTAVTDRNVASTDSGAGQCSSLGIVKADKAVPTVGACREGERRPICRIAYGRTNLSRRGACRAIPLSPASTTTGFGPRGPKQIDQTKYEDSFSAHKVPPTIHPSSFRFSPGHKIRRPA